MRRGGTKPPSVLVILVVKDGAGWLRQCLLSLSRQTHPRIGVLAVDNGSSDGSADILESALGPSRVIRDPTNRGFGAAVGAAIRAGPAHEADYLLLLHDDTLLAPDAVASLVETAERVDGVGVVGPKVLDWHDPRMLVDIGHSTDRFGYPYSPLEEGEVDQGQYDRVREVMFVSSCAMLVARAAWERVGPPDERFEPRPEDMDFCWRTRVAGFRVLMTPQAIARHRNASQHGERTDQRPRARAPYYRERAALAGVLKNYGWVSLLWILPLFLIQGLARVAALLVRRRFEDAYQVLAAWGWNLFHLPGTVGRRVRTQAVRRIPDRHVYRFMAPTGLRLRTWATAASELLLPRAGAEPDGGAAPSLTRRLMRFGAERPVVVAWALGLVVAAVAYRHLVGGSPLAGGGSAAFPTAPTTFFREFVSGLRSTGLGGSQSATPALGALGAASVVSFASPPLLEKLLLLGLPALAGFACYRAVRSITGASVPAVVAAASYALSAVMLWVLSEGRIPALVFLAGLPWLGTKLQEAFEARLAVRPVRWIVGAGLGLALLTAFFPGALLAAAVLAGSALLVPAAGSRRGRGLIRTAAAAAVAAALLFPVVLDVLRLGSPWTSEPAGPASFGALARLSLGPGPGAWVVAFFLPAAAALALAFASGRFGRTAVRSAISAVVAVHLAWLGAAGYLPAFLSNPVAYVGAAAFSYVVLVGLGITSLVEGVSRTAFGPRQVGAASLTLILGTGLLLQAGQAGRGGWAVGGTDLVPAAYPVVARAAGEHRILWLGRWGGDAFPAPGGLPDGTIEVGEASVRFAIRSRTGASALDTGRAAAGPGYEALRSVLVLILGGESRHGGALLAPFGIRFIVAGPGDLPDAALSRLREQVDLDLMPAGGLTIFRNPKAVPPGAVVRSRDWVAAAGEGSPAAASTLPEAAASPVGQGPILRGVARVGSLVLVAVQYDSRWGLTASGGTGRQRPERAFGWAVAFTPSAEGPMEVRYGGQAVRTAEVAFLAVLWLAALWITRRPVRGR